MRATRWARFGSMGRQLCHGIFAGSGPHYSRSAATHGRATSNHSGDGAALDDGARAVCEVATPRPNAACAARRCENFRAPSTPSWPRGRGAEPGPGAGLHAPQTGHCAGGRGRPRAPGVATRNSLRCCGRQMVAHRGDRPANGDATAASHLARCAPRMGNGRVRAGRRGMGIGDGMGWMVALAAGGLQFPAVASLRGHATQRGAGHSAGAPPGHAPPHVPDGGRACLLRTCNFQVRAPARPQQPGAPRQEQRRSPQR